MVRPTVTVVNESTLLDWATGVKGLLQCIEYKIGTR
ncbi:hypothetical protein Pgy4_41052, partial [Pseudomonas savastanoi pv. glycinea str. race 4]